MSKAYDKEQLLIDWRTGDFTQRDLAHKHGVSQTLVNKLVKDIPQDLKELVIKKLSLDQELAEKSNQEVITITLSVDHKKGLIKDIEFFSNRAIKKAVELLEMSDSGNDLKAIVDAVDKISVTNNINDRHAKPNTTTIQNNTQNNYENLTTEELRRELAEIDRRRAIKSSH